MRGDNLLDRPEAEPIRNLMEKLWGDIQRFDREGEERRAKADPVKHRNSRVFRNSDYRFYETRNGRGSRVRFCYSVHPNVAGYFLMWREVVTKREVRRDQWDSTKLKSDAIWTCRKKWEAANNK